MFKKGLILATVLGGVVAVTTAKYLKEKFEEAEAEKDRLHGVGIAEQRKAIVDGLADSIQELKGANVELTEEQIMSILLTNQYLDTLNNFADKQGNNTIFLPANPNGVEDIRTHILSALKAK